MSAVPARFDASQQRRRAMLAKVHIAKAQLGMVDDDYQAVLLRVGGRVSAGDMNERSLAAVLAEFERLGFSARAKRPGAKPADHPVARKARALWISLSHLGAIDDPSEHALEAFARRQLGCERMQWANQRQGFRLIEALKAIGARHGWHHDDAPALTGASTDGKLIGLKRRLVEAIAAKLVAADLMPAHWTIEQAAWKLGGVELPRWPSAGEYDLAAKALGDALRTAR